MMQDIISIPPSMTELNLKASASSSNVSRLSVSTVVATHLAVSTTEISEHDEQQDDTMDSNMCSRSQSVRSQDSNQASSSVDTDESRCLSDCANKSTLIRNGSWASTVPTSPETELSIGHIGSSNDNLILKFKEPDLTLASDLQEVKVSVEDIEAKLSSIANRNKPLPIPVELRKEVHGLFSAKSISTENPSVHINPDSDGTIGDAKARSSSADVSPTISSSDEGPSSKSGIRSMMDRSSQLFRRANDSRGSNVKKSPSVPARRKSNGISAKETLAWFYRSLPPSPSGSVVDLPSTQTDSDPMGRNALDSQVQISFANIESLTPSLPSSEAAPSAVKSLYSSKRAESSKFCEAKKASSHRFDVKTNQSMNSPTSTRPSLRRNRCKGLTESGCSPEVFREDANKIIENALLPHLDSIAVGTTSILEAHLPNIATIDQKGCVGSRANYLERNFDVETSNHINARNANKSSARGIISSSETFSYQQMLRGEDRIKLSRRHSKRELSGRDDDSKRNALGSASSSCYPLHHRYNSYSPIPPDSINTPSPALLQRQKLEPMSQIVHPNSGSPRYSDTMNSCKISAKSLTQEKGVALLPNSKKLNPATGESVLPSKFHHSRRASGERKLKMSKGIEKSRPRSVCLSEFQQSANTPPDEMKVQRRPSQATLSIADDVEFLQALEHVRKMNQERIRRKEEVASRVSQLARMGMASGNKRGNRADCAMKVSQHREIHDERDYLIRKISSQKRSSSADARYHSADITLDTSKEELSAMKDQSGLKTQDTVPSALELGVGKASGKGRDDCAFMNDEDWKQEVKALFIIRELVLTERSYARHLEALLQAIRNHYIPDRKMSVNSSMNRQSGQFPPHFLLMRNLLPQLIALSRSLANQIDANPTAAGVGFGFRTVQSQMEATFIAWSSSIKEIMEGLRLNEKTKSKSIHRLGLINLIPTEATSCEMVSVNHKRDDGFISVPSSPKSSPRNTKRLSVGGTPLALVSNTRSTIAAPLPTRTNSNSDYALSSRIAKRRSTFSGLAPSLLAPPKSPSGIGRKALDAVVSSSRPRFIGPAKSTTLPAISVDRKKGFLMSSSGHLSVEQDVFGDSSEDSTPLNSPSIPIAKRLSAMDIAIMPTQRLPRYLLLIRDLNTNTPPQSLSHVRLQRSLDMLMDLAGRCDRASK